MVLADHHLGGSEWDRNQVHPTCVWTRSRLGDVLCIPSGRYSENNIIEAAKQGELDQRRLRDGALVALAKSKSAKDAAADAIRPPQLAASFLDSTGG
jgi:hypothetical protein